MKDIQQPELPESWLIVNETAIKLEKQRPTLGYTFFYHPELYPSYEAASAAIKEKQLPLGWVCGKLSQFLPIATQMHAHAAAHGDACYAAGVEEGGVATSKEAQRAFENIRNNYVGWEDNENFAILRNALFKQSLAQPAQEPFQCPHCGEIDGTCKPYRGKYCEGKPAQDSALDAQQPAQASVPEGQTIESAPQHTEILLWWKSSKRWHLGRWIDDERGEGWLNDGDECLPKNQKDCTHWMPLPAAPASEVEK